MISSIIIMRCLTQANHSTDCDGQIASFRSKLNLCCELFRNDSVASLIQMDCIRKVVLIGRIENSRKIINSMQRI